MKPTSGGGGVGKGTTPDQCRPFHDRVGCTVATVDSLWIGREEGGERLMMALGMDQGFPMDDHSSTGGNGPPRSQDVDRSLLRLARLAGPGQEMTRTGRAWGANRPNPSGIGHLGR